MSVRLWSLPQPMLLLRLKVSSLHDFSFFPVFMLYLFILFFSLTVTATPFYPLFWPISVYLTLKRTVYYRIAQYINFIQKFSQTEIYIIIGQVVVPRHADEIAGPPQAVKK
jgi:hypothetical protein